MSYPLTSVLRTLEPKQSAVVKGTPSTISAIVRRLEGSYHQRRMLLVDPNNNHTETVYEVTRTS